MCSGSFRCAWQENRCAVGAIICGHWDGVKRLFHRARNESVVFHWNRPRNDEASVPKGESVARQSCAFPRNYIGVPFVTIQTARGASYAFGTLGIAQERVQA